MWDLVSDCLSQKNSHTYSHIWGLSLKLKSQLSIRVFTPQKWGLGNLWRVSLNPSVLSDLILDFMNVFQHLLFKLVLKLSWKSFLFSMSVDLSFINLNDVFLPFQTIVDSEGVGWPSMLEGEGDRMNGRVNNLEFSNRSIRSSSANFEQLSITLQCSTE